MSQQLSYNTNISNTLTQVNSFFVQNLSLSSEFRNENILPGERYGILFPRTLRLDSRRTPPHRNTRSGVTEQEIVLEMLVILGMGQDRIKAQNQGIETMLMIENLFPQMKEVLPYPEVIDNATVAFDLIQNADISQTLSQSLQAPYHLIVNITCEAILKVAVRKNAQGGIVNFIPEN